MQTPVCQGWTPMIIASQEGYTNVVELLLKHEIQPNITNTINGITSLILACQNGHHDTAELLLSNGADPNIQASNGVAAIHQACYNGHYTVTELLQCNDHCNMQTLTYQIMMGSHP